jgi:hypothetical protein
MVGATCPRLFTRPSLCNTVLKRLKRNGLHATLVVCCRTATVRSGNALSVHIFASSMTFAVKDLLALMWLASAGNLRQQIRAGATRIVRDCACILTATKLCVLAKEFIALRANKCSYCSKLLVSCSLFYIIFL